MCYGLCCRTAQDCWAFSIKNLIILKGLGGSLLHGEKYTLEGKSKCRRLWQIDVKKKKGSKKKSRIYYPLQCPFNWSLISNIICVLKEYSVFSGIPKTRGFVYCTMTPDTCTCPGAFGEYWFAQTWLLNSSALLYPLLNYLMTSHF